MESEYWKSSFTIDGVTYHLAGSKGESKAVFQVGDSNLYRCYTYNKVIGVAASLEHVTWEQAEKFLKG